MGQTLSHGVYLPAEGERNCYSGLASNWNLLDTAIGDTAGKASATHTHGNISSDGKVGTTANLPLITGTGGAVQAGAFGNQANTFCEGNDSRLSDARTPVAHTHGKADITDLFNSANTWSALNTYSNGQIRIKSQSQERGVIPSSSVIQYLEFSDKNDAQHGKIGLWDYDNGASEIQVSISDKYKNGAKDPTGTLDTAFLSFGFQYNGTKFITFSGQVNNSVIPLANNTYDLGSSSYKWKSFNGINPGALSLPSGGTTENTDWFNVAGSILPTGGNATSFSRATANYFIPAKDGWLALAVKNCSELSVWCDTLKYGISIVAPDASVNRQTVIPVVAGKSYQILITGNSWISARLIMPQGNV